MAPHAPSGEADRRLEQALAERDEALLALAREREKYNALRLLMLSRGEADLPEYPTTTAPGEPPLRYVLVDRANDGIKKMLGPLQRRVKTAVMERGKK